MTVYHRTVPSAALGEYLSDVQRFYDYFARSPFLAPEEPIKPTLAASLEHGLAGSLNEWFGEEHTRDYWRWLIDRTKRERQRQRRPKREIIPDSGTISPAKVEAVKVEKIVDTATILAESKRKPWQDARHVNERKMREAILKVVGSHGWTHVGERKLAELADNMKHRTARTVLDRMAADGQIKLDRTKTRGPKTGVYVVREHPCWSDQKHAQSLAQSKLSDQLRG
jgi:hypothetical protein